MPVLGKWGGHNRLEAPYHHTVDPAAFRFEQSQASIYEL